MKVNNFLRLRITSDDVPEVMGDILDFPAVTGSDDYFFVIAGDFHNFTAIAGDDDNISMTAGGVHVSLQ